MARVPGEEDGVLGTGREAGRGQGTRAAGGGRSAGVSDLRQGHGTGHPVPPSSPGERRTNIELRRRGDFRKTQLPRLLIYFARVSQKFHGASTLLLLLIKKSTGATFFFVL